MDAPKIPSTITYKKAGTSPPVFIAGSFSEPSWHPQEMECTIAEDGEATFTTQVMIEPGKEYQFKFRAGHTDWWFLDEQAPTVTDESGNQNNLLTVPIPTKEEEAPINEPALEPEAASKPKDEAKSGLAPIQPQINEPISDNDSEEDEVLKTPLFAHESFGTYEFPEDDLDLGSPASSRSKSLGQTKPKDLDATTLDFNDPTLEKFPSERQSVMEALRTIQTNLDEDRVHLNEAVSSHPISRKTSIDSTDESGLSLSTSPTSSRRRESRHSHSSFGRTRSAVSLVSIEEEEPKVAEEEKDAPEASSLTKKTGAVFDRPQSPTSEYDEEEDVAGVATQGAEVNLDQKTENDSPSQTVSDAPVAPPKPEEQPKSIDDEPASIEEPTLVAEASNNHEIPSVSEQPEKTESLYDKVTTEKPEPLVDVDDSHYVPSASEQPTSTDERSAPIIESSNVPVVTVESKEQPKAVDDETATKEKPAPIAEAAKMEESVPAVKVSDIRDVPSIPEQPKFIDNVATTEKLAPVVEAEKARGVPSISEQPNAVSPMPATLVSKDDSPKELSNPSPLVKALRSLSALLFSNGRNTFLTASVTIFALGIGLWNKVEKQAKDSLARGSGV